VLKQEHSEIRLLRLWSTQQLPIFQTFVGGVRKAIDELEESY